MGEWTLITYLQAGAYAAIMAAVLGVPQMLSGYFDLKARRQQEERQEERRREERRQDEERRREERRQDEERLREERRQDEELRRQDEEVRRQEMANMEQRHQEIMVALIAALTRGNNHGSGQSHDNGQSELIRTLQQTIEDLRAENDRLRRERGDGDLSSTS